MRLETGLVTDNADDETAPTEVRQPDPPAKFFAEGTFNDWLGLTVEEMDEGRVVLSVEYDDVKANPGDVLHGGVTASLIDVAGGMAIGSSEEGSDAFMATTNLNVHYLRPITDTAYATAEVVRVGSSSAVAEVEVHSHAPDGERKQVALGTVTYQQN